MCERVGAGQADVRTKEAQREERRGEKFAEGMSARGEERSGKRRAGEAGREQEQSTEASKRERDTRHKRQTGRQTQEA
eukprot:1519561-Rhodomonas_salina.1